MGVVVGITPRVGARVVRTGAGVSVAIVRGVIALEASVGVVTGRTIVGEATAEISGARSIDPQPDKIVMIIAAKENRSIVFMRDAILLVLK